MEAFEFDNVDEAEDLFVNFQQFTHKEQIITKSKISNEIKINCMKTNKNILIKQLKNCETVVLYNFEVQIEPRGDAELNKVLKCFSKLINELDLKKITIKS